MKQQRPIGQSVYHQALEKLLFMIREHAFHERKLPAEDILAKQLGISRTVLRDVLTSIETLGFITRKRGVGTIINEHIVDAKPRLDIDLIVEQAVIDAGHVPNLAHVEMVIIPATQKIATALEVPIGTRVVQVERLIEADGQSAVLIVQCFLESVLKGPYLFEEFHHSVLEFFAKRCNIQIDTNLAIVKPLIADQHLAARMKIEVGTVLLYLDEIDYDHLKRPVLWSEEYFVSDLIEFKMLRRKV